MRIGRTAVVTDTGRRRIGNEDAYVFKPPLFAIADGMGGARAGEIAAGLAAAALEELTERPQDEGALRALIVDANRRIWERSLSDPSTAGMGTTLTAALVDAAAGTVSFGHVGDSRAYRLRDGELEQITTDHSLVAELIASGVLTPEEAARHPQRSAITRALGTEPEVDADVFTVDAEPGDLFLLCSDGLTDMLSEDDIAAAIESVHGAPEAAGQALVAAANARGGEDNITVLLFELVEGEPDESPTEVAVAVAPPETDGAEPRTEGGAQPVTTHGAGTGGRLPALLLVLGILAVAALLLYWGISR
jgi:serine/threonine protein phosphatase PrpC